MAYNLGLGINTQAYNHRTNSITMLSVLIQKDVGCSRKMYDKKVKISDAFEK